MIYAVENVDTLRSVKRYEKGAPVPRPRVCTAPELRRVLTVVGGLQPSNQRSFTPGALGLRRSGAQVPEATARPSLARAGVLVPSWGAESVGNSR